MTNPQLYALGQLDYTKLTEDERNECVALLEGAYQSPSTFHEGRNTRVVNFWYLKGHCQMLSPPDYLNDWALCFGLIEKYGLDLVYEPRYKGTVDAWTAYNMNNRKDQDDWYPSGNAQHPEAAIIEAVCEIWREQQKEKAIIQTHRNPSVFRLPKQKEK